MLTASQLRQVEDRLLQDRDRALRTLGLLTEQAEEATKSAAGDLSGYPLHSADVGTEEFEREQAFSRAGQEGRYFEFIEEALQRLYAAPESFGTCQSCGNPISLERLLAVPHTRYCHGCKVRLEGVEELPR
jgi:RNA polymerase-binding transcription factor DksA